MSAQLAVLQRLVFGRSSERARPQPAAGNDDQSGHAPIKIFRGEGGELFSLDNRRLFAGQYADVKLPYQWATKSEIARRDMTYVDGGQSIRIRGEGWWSNG